MYAVEHSNHRFLICRIPCGGLKEAAALQALCKREPYRSGEALVWLSSQSHDLHSPQARLVTRSVYLGNGGCEDRCLCCREKTP